MIRHYRKAGAGLLCLLMATSQVRASEAFNPLIDSDYDPVSHNDFAEARRLLNSNRGLANTVGRTGDLPLIRVTTTEMAELLLKYGADVNKPNTYGVTPLLAAMGRRPLVLLYLAKGAKVNARDKDGVTPLIKEFMKPSQDSLNDAYPDLDIVRLLIRKGADVNARDNFGRSPLFYSVQLYRRNTRKCLPAVQILLWRHAKVNISDVYGMTPLHVAVDGGMPTYGDGGHQLNREPEMAELLLKNGANVNAETKRGARPLDWAMQSKSEQVIAVLRRYGAKPY